MEEGEGMRIEIEHKRQEEEEEAFPSDRLFDSEFA